MPASCAIQDGNFTFGLSKWVSPKRTRSYPYERVYNTLGCAKRITVIPIIKDEGAKGDRDYIQWDTVSLMSLLDVFVVFSYYKNADKHPKREDKITNQQFDNHLVLDKIKEIRNYHSSALHWNLKEIGKTFPELIRQVKKSYEDIGDEYGVKFHSADGIDKFASRFISGVDEFMRSSREKAKEAQNREMKTIQPKEALSSLTKASITIENYLGGKYYFTTDEILITEKQVFLIESKHSKTSVLPGIGDVKDGLLKMILYSNLEKVVIDGSDRNAAPVLKLTSTRLKSAIDSTCNQSDLDRFGKENNLPERQIEILTKLFDEARSNKFSVNIEYAE